MLRILARKIYVSFLKYIRHRLEGYQYRKKAGLSSIDVLPINSFSNLGLVAIFKAEDDYLVEWIEFHRMMGVDHFILYDNGLEKSSQAILKPYCKKGIVTHIPFPDIPGLRDGKHADTLSIQQLAYGDFILRFSHYFKYILQLDIDEFLFPKSHNTIQDVLNHYNNSHLEKIEINVTNFGDNGHLTKPSGLVIENFTKSGNCVVPRVVKSVSSTKYLSKVYAHTSVHRFSHRFSIKNMLTKLFFRYPIIVKGKTANNLFQLNHYITKSKEEFLTKGEKYKIGWQYGKKNANLYTELNRQYNMVDNHTILRYLPNLTNKLKLL